MDDQAIVSLSGGTKNAKDLMVHCALDDGKHPAGLKVSDADLASVNLQRHGFPR